MKNRIVIDIDYPMSKLIGQDGNEKEIKGFNVVKNTGEDLDVWTETRLIQMAQKSSYEDTVDLNDPSFDHPQVFFIAIINYFKGRNLTPPSTNNDIIRCIYHSLAKYYVKEVNNIKINDSEIELHSKIDVSYIKEVMEEELNTNIKIVSES